MPSVVGGGAKPGGSSDAHGATVGRGAAGRATGAERGGSDALMAARPPTAKVKAQRRVNIFHPALLVQDNGHAHNGAAILTGLSNGGRARHLGHANELATGVDAQEAFKEKI